MAKKSKYTLILFYRNDNKQSLQIKIALNNLFAKYGNTNQLTVKEVNYKLENKICQQYGIMGTPALLILQDGELRGRILGEISTNDLDILIHNLLNTNKT